MTTTALDLEAALLELTKAFPSDGPGGVIAVARAGAIEVLVPFGLANLEHEVPNTPETVFYVASVSKQFVAAAAALLEADGLLDPEAPIATWLPEVAHLGDIRVHHLVHHTSGIRDKYALGALGGMPEEAYSTDLGTLAMLRRQRTLNFPPGERFEYSNSGYFLLARLIERASGRPFVEVTNERLFAPLEMTGTRFRSDTSEVVPHRASGYAADPATNAPRLHEYTWTSLGPGGVVSTAASLARWGLVWQGTALPGLADRLAITRPFNNGATGHYGYGVMLAEHAGLRLVRHAGGVHGFSAEMLQLPEQALTVVALCNSGAISAPLLAEKALGLVVSTLEKTTAAGVAVPASDDLEGVYTSPGEGSLATVTREDTGLLLTVGPMRIPLPSQGFRVSREDATLVVVGPTGMTLRFDEVPDGPPTLTDVVGDYASEELGTVVTISHGADGFAACWPDQEPSAMTHIAGDLYAVPISKIGMTALGHFLGDGSRADALRLGTDRATGTVLTRAG